jgi:hypothetical protein
METHKNEHYQMFSPFSVEKTFVHQLIKQKEKIKTS